MKYYKGRTCGDCWVITPHHDQETPCGYVYREGDEVFRIAIEAPTQQEVIWIADALVELLNKREAGQ